jgi:hypothetical protein
LNYAHAFDYANRELAGAGVIVANVDIFFDEALGLTDEVMVRLSPTKVRRPLMWFIDEAAVRRVVMVHGNGRRRESFRSVGLGALSVTVAGIVFGRQY